ncbi:tripartite tricarboxylate transporter TctB family protein [Leucobacter sp. NPDC058333]|uniref:tripartite tricarboxylate transporter TctB family protein n=1 Tax=Leucobacter sp. NPDC058333 TaxID=3346450 RepID=UPI003648AD29
MMPTNNPTAMSAVVGEEIRLAAGTGRSAELLKHLIMPALLVAFAAYLGFGMLTMRVPEGTAFPGPRFFPTIIASGLVLFAILLVVSAIKQLRAEAAERAAATRQLDDFELISMEGSVGGGAADFASADGTASAALTSADGTAVESRAVKIDWRSLAWIVGAFIGFALLLNVLGWVISAGLLFWCVARGFGSQKPIASLITGLTVSSLAYIAFAMALGMSLPSGILGGGF